jgi:hypothetical protein
MVQSTCTFANVIEGLDACLIDSMKISVSVESIKGFESSSLCQLILLVYETFYGRGISVGRGHLLSMMKRIGRRISVDEVWGDEGFPEDEL